MLRLPSEGEEAPPLVKAALSKDTENLDDGEIDVSGEPGETSPVALLIGMSVAGLALLAGFAFWLKPRVADRPAAVAITAPVLPQVKIDNPMAAALDSNRILRDAEPLMKGFLDAKTMEEALKYVAQPARARERWVALQKGKAFEMPGFRKINEKSISVSGKLASLAVVTEDYSNRQIAFRLDDGGMKIDWEAWVGWSEMNWADFRSQKPVEAKLFRVILSKVNYYNFDFTNDSEWTSYRLESPDHEESIFGYAKATGELDAKIRPMEEKGRDFLILRLRFPEGAKTDNQVIIDDCIGQGWIEP